MQRRDRITSQQQDGEDAVAAGRRRRTRRLIVGPTPPLAAAVHALNGFAEACFTVSLAGSLFLSVSFDAARPRIIVYLACTLAPFVLVAPILGPLVDRIRGGHRAMVLLTMVGRAGICVALAGQLRDVLVFPLAFAMLVLAKTYSVTRNAMVPRLVESGDLVEVNSRLSLLSTVASGVGGACAAGLLVLTSASLVPLLATIAYLLGALVSLRLPPTTERVAHPDDVIVWSELHARLILTAQSSMLALKGVSGFLLFFLGMYLKRSGSATWFFGLVFVANGVGSVVGTILSPFARRRLSEKQMLAAAVIGAAGVAAVAAVAANRAGTVIAAFGVGLFGAVASQAFNAAVQQHAPDVDRGRTLAAFDTRFQLAWVTGALVAVTVRPSLRIGFASLMVLLLADAIDQFLRRSGDSVAEPANHETLAQLALSARRLEALGNYRGAALVATAAAELVGGEGRVALTDMQARLVSGEAVDRDTFVALARAVGWQFDA